MNVIIARNSDSVFQRGEICKIISVNGSMLSVVDKHGHTILIDIEDENFLVLFSATEQEVEWISRNFF